MRSAIARSRRWRSAPYDPVVAERFADIVPSLLHRLEAEPIWSAVFAAEPAPVRQLSDVEVAELERGHQEDRWDYEEAAIATARAWVPAPGDPDETDRVIRAVASGNLSQGDFRDWIADRCG